MLRRRLDNVSERFANLFHDGDPVYSYANMNGFPANDMALDMDEGVEDVGSFGPDGASADDSAQSLPLATDCEFILCRDI